MSIRGGPPATASMCVWIHSLSAIACTRFDLVFETDSTQLAVYDGCVSSLLDGCMQLTSTRTIFVAQVCVLFSNSGRATMQLSSRTAKQDRGQKLALMEPQGRMA